MDEWAWGKVKKIMDSESRNPFQNNVYESHVINLLLKGLSQKKGRSLSCPILKSLFYLFKYRHKIGVIYFFDLLLSFYHDALYYKIDIF